MRLDCQEPSFCKWWIVRSTAELTFLSNILSVHIAFCAAFNLLCLKITFLRSFISLSIICISAVSAECRTTENIINIRPVECHSGHDGDDGALEPGLVVNIRQDVLVTLLVGGWAAAVSLANNQH